MSLKHPGEAFLTADKWEVVAGQFRLTRRELSVAILIFEGKTRYQIARRLHCAPGTVRTYIDRLFAKLEVEDRLGMALRVVRVLIPPTADSDHKRSYSAFDGKS
jgi:DNA-binding NarL/FixJ family response regulator